MIRQTPPGGIPHPAAVAKILNREKRGKDQYFFSTGTIQPLVSGMQWGKIPDTKGWIVPVEKKN